MFVQYGLYHYQDVQKKKTTVGLEGSRTPTTSDELISATRGALGGTKRLLHVKACESRSLPTDRHHRVDAANLTSRHARNTPPPSDSIELLM
jgi:hypothetical protein